MLQVTREELVGIDAVLERLEKYRVYLQHFEEFEKAGIPNPHGLFLFGPKGTGKTTAAYYLATQADAEIVSVYDLKDKKVRWTTDAIDHAFLRKERFDDLIEFHPPDYNGKKTLAFS